MIAKVHLRNKKKGRKLRETRWALNSENLKKCMSMMAHLILMKQKRNVKLKNSNNIKLKN
jgi:hypothetical protein